MCVCVWFKIYLQNELHTSDSLEGKNEEGLEALPLTHRVALQLPHQAGEFPILLPENEAVEAGRGGPENPGHSQQLANQGLLVHHVGHVRHVEAAEGRAVLQHHVSDLEDDHALFQPRLQIHEEPGAEAASASTPSRPEQRVRGGGGARGRARHSLFAGHHHSEDVGEQAVVLQPGQGAFQRSGGVEVIDGYAEAPQVGRLGADQLEHRLRREGRRDPF